MGVRWLCFSLMTACGSSDTSTSDTSAADEADTAAADEAGTEEAGEEAVTSTDGEIVIGILGCVVLAVVIEKVAYTPLRSAPRISLLITAIGVSLLLQNLAQLFYSANPRAYPNTSIIPSVSLSFGGLSVSLTAILTIIVSVIAMAVLTFLVQKTRMGKAMRAVSEDMAAARLMGINLNATISFTFAVGSALAGIGAILYCCKYPQVSPTMGSLLGLKAFVLTALPLLLQSLSSYRMVVYSVLLILVMIFKPSGLLGTYDFSLSRILERIINRDFHFKKKEVESND